ncbi:MAG: hypothetical protein RI917_95 [Actinomycetota bacterium]|jgi:DNA-binding LacI/PurR family transcriptional regulator
MSPESPKRTPTIYDVANRAGVSKSLVSLVLHGDPRVSEVKRQAVLLAIEALEYRPSRTAQLLASKYSKTVGVIITEYKNLSYVSVVKGLREVFDEVGIQVTLSDLHRRADFASDPVDAFLAMNVDGIVFICEPDGLNYKNLDVPSVMIGDRSSKVPTADLVSNDDNVGMHLVLDHLYSLGHRKIVHITGAGGIAKVRESAYLEFIASKRLKALVFGQEQPTNEIGGYMAARELLESGQEFTAIVTANDYMAAGVWSTFREAGIRVPQDVSLSGYDNSPIASDYLLKLTTVDEEGIQVGRRAAELLLARFSESKQSKSKQVWVRPSLIIRESTRKPKAKN